MGIIEGIFDITYLVLILSLGLGLMLKDNKNAELFGLMAIVLGLGDSFHLIPRVISHLSPGGFEAHVASLSWGKFVTSITMTIFYLLFFYYYRQVTGDKGNKKKLIFWGLTLLRILLVALPANNRGSSEENYKMGIYRNIPFLLMGIILIIWMAKYKDKPAIKGMPLLIGLSFAFYLPVVIGARKIPALGALMMPKTIVYVLMVVKAYKLYKGEFSSQRFLDFSEICLIMGLGFGVFFREFTKFYNFTGVTHLSKVHGHALILGFILMLVLFCLTKNLDGAKLKDLEKANKLYLVGLLLTLASMLTYGIYDVVSQGKQLVNVEMLAGISGLGHIILSLGLLTLINRIRKAYKVNMAK